MEKALIFIDDNILDTNINRIFLSELHKIVVNNLTTEGSITPGEYRNKNVVIEGANFSPPDYSNVLDYMDELLKFICELNNKHFILRNKEGDFRLTEQISCLPISELKIP